MNKTNSNLSNIKISLTDSGTDLVPELLNKSDKINSKNDSNNKIFNQNYYREIYKNKSFDEIIKEIPHHSDR